MSQTSPQASQINELFDEGAVEGLLARSHEAPVVLFKHSLTCPISAYAYREMLRISADVAPEVALIVVQHARAVSKEIAARTGVRHESPQAIVLRKAAPVWSASHYDITAEAVEQAVKDNG